MIAYSSVGLGVCSAEDWVAIDTPGLLYCGAGPLRVEVLELCKSRFNASVSMFAGVVEGPSVEHLPIVMLRYS